MRKLALATVGAAAALAGCATAPPAAVTTFAGSACVAEPNLAGAVSLTPKKSDETAFVVTTKVDGMTPCLSRAGQSGPYVVYALPESREGKVITVGSVLEAARLVPPSVALLDGTGKVTRTFAASDFFFRGPVYSVQFQPRVEDAFVLVTTDAGRVGQRYEAISIGTQTSSSAVGTTGGYISWTTGVDQKIARTFSYEGSIQATVYGGASSAKK
jgi:hypothetical protein